MIARFLLAVGLSVLMLVTSVGTYMYLGGRQSKVAVPAQKPTAATPRAHAYNLTGPVFDLATTVSKLIHVGLELPDALRRATATPAKFLKMESEVGTLAVGACADMGRSCGR